MLTGGGRIWSREHVSTASYDAAGRNPAWEYDAAGNVVSRHEPPPAGFDGTYQAARYTFDAAGRQVSVAQTRGHFDANSQLHTDAYTNTTGYDGEGRPVTYTHLRVSNGTPYPETARYLRSTALGGAVVSEYDGAGAWGESFVYAGGARVGRQGRRPGLDTPLASWLHVNPVTGDETVTEADGGPGEGGDMFLDPLGNAVGQPFPPGAAGGEDIPAPFDNGFTGSRDVGQYLAPGGGAADIGRGWRRARHAVIRRRQAARPVRCHDHFRQPAGDGHHDLLRNPVHRPPGRGDGLTRGGTSSTGTRPPPLARRGPQCPARGSTAAYRVRG